MDEKLSPAGRYRLLRELGSRSVPTFAARVSPGEGAKSAKEELVVLLRLARGGAVSDEEVADFIRDARRLAELDHPNIARVRDVAIGAADVSVAYDFIDGETFEEVLRRAALPLEAKLRVLTDILNGLGALHNLRDVKRQPLNAIHGEVMPANVLVGVDGTSRLLLAFRARAATRPGHPGSGYLAPEVLLADGTVDARADVYSVGALLWQVLSGKPLFEDAAPHTIVAHLLSGKIPKASVPTGAPWAAGLAAVADRALSVDPSKRFAHATEMLAEIRRIAGPKLATTGRVSSILKGALGSRIAARRAELESAAPLSLAPPPLRPNKPDDTDTLTPVRDVAAAYPPPAPVAEEAWDVDVTADDDATMPPQPNAVAEALRVSAEHEIAAPRAAPPIAPIPPLPSPAKPPPAPLPRPVGLPPLPNPRPPMSIPTPLAVPSALLLAYATPPKPPEPSAPEVPAAAVTGSVAAPFEPPPAPRPVLTPITPPANPLPGGPPASPMRTPLPSEDVPPVALPRRSAKVIALIAAVPFLALLVWTILTVTQSGGSASLAAVRVPEFKAAPTTDTSGGAPVLADTGSQSASASASSKSVSPAVGVAAPERTAAPHATATPAFTNAAHFPAVLPPKKTAPRTTYDPQGI